MKRPMIFTAAAIAVFAVAPAAANSATSRSAAPQYEADPEISDESTAEAEQAVDPYDPNAHDNSEPLPEIPDPAAVAADPQVRESVVAKIFGKKGTKVAAEAEAIYAEMGKDDEAVDGDGSSSTASAVAPLLRAIFKGMKKKKPLK